MSGQKLDERWDEKNVYVYFANGLGSGNTLKVTLYYMMQEDPVEYTKSINFTGPGHVSVHLNYIDKLVMKVGENSITAAIGISSDAFDGQPKTAYFTTMVYDHPSFGRKYKVEWRSDGKLRGLWDYKKDA
jgi:hypothetical protein